MKFKETYTSPEQRTRKGEEENGKILISEESYAVGLLLNEINNNLKFFKLKKW